MTPKEKAKELVKKYDFIATGPYEWTSEAKRCALIAVDEILNAYSKYDYANNNEYYDPYYLEVKQEVEKL